MLYSVAEAVRLVRRFREPLERFVVALARQLQSGRGADTARRG